MIWFNPEYAARVVFPFYTRRAPPGGGPPVWFRCWGDTEAAVNREAVSRFFLGSWAPLRGYCGEVDRTSGRKSRAAAKDARPCPVCAAAVLLALEDLPPLERTTSRRTPGECVASYRREWPCGAHLSIRQGPWRQVFESLRVLA